MENVNVFVLVNRDENDRAEKERSQKNDELREIEFGER